MQAKPAIQPFFLDDQGCKLFAVYYQPPAKQQVEKIIIHIPAFADEMNKARRMVSSQAREFAKQGYGVLVLDLFGTGDSEGSFSEATWAIWKQNIKAAYTWACQQGATSVSLWSLRSGALLAMDFVAESHAKINTLLAWQPVLNGELFIMQFLRLRVAAAMMDKQAPQEKTADLKQQLLDGSAVEVAGYLLNSKLVTPLIGLSVNDMSLSTITRIRFFELVTSEDKPVTAITTHFIEDRCNKNQDASFTKVVGSAFWSAQEIVEVPELLSATVVALKSTIKDFSGFSTMQLRVVNA